MDSTRAAYDEVYVYAMGRPEFILQHVVDAFGVQNANEHDPAIRVVFGLIGLYLHIEKNYSGRQIQKVHMKLGQKKREWPKIHLPENRGSMSVLDVRSAPAGVERDRAIGDWCRSVWAAFVDHRSMILSLLQEFQIT